MKKPYKVLVIIAGVIILALALVCALPRLADRYIEWKENNWYITEDVVNYGDITHNSKSGNNYVKTFVNSFFPERIEPYFENVQYQYKARSWCDYCCEVYLEFTISDRDAYLNFVEEATEGLTSTQFAYDNQFEDYIVYDALLVDENDYQTENGGYYLDAAKMGRILVCKDEQRIIYHAIMVTSCC